MTSLHEALTDYLRIRRGEGVKFEKIGLALEHFVEFLEERGAERVRWTGFHGDVVCGVSSFSL